MKKVILLACLLAMAIVASGCIDTGHTCPDGTKVSNPVHCFPPEPPPLTGIPDECKEFENDVCMLFDCMVDRCWCDESSPEGAVLAEGRKGIERKEEAMEMALLYLERIGSEYSDVKNAVKLNDVFFNVFAYNSEGDEMVLTVAVNGTIIRTVCGV